MNTAETLAWERLRTALSAADSVAFDGCHKIYVLVDKEGTAAQRDLGYGDGTDDSRLLLVSELNSVAPDGAFNTVQNWFRDSCFLRFVSGIKGTGRENEHYFHIIEQGAEEDWEDRPEPEHTCQENINEYCEACG